MGCWTPPFGNPQVLAGAVSELAELLAASRLELRCRWGRPRARARSPRLPHLHRFGVGAYAPWPPAFPARGRLPVMRVCPPRSPLGKAGTRPGARSLARAPRGAGRAPGGAPRPARPREPAVCATSRDRVRGAATPPQICAEAPAANAARSSVTPLARLWPKATLARPPAGNPKGGAALFGQSLPTFCWPESRGPGAA